MLCWVRLKAGETLIEQLKVQYGTFIEYICVEVL